ncbi:uncharacterized protein BDZ83DRAFT_647959 [Colletotrichum acutatum]|uniref:Uncharacterized protein n=1 Tax=Glomerella acutata TaxID=27357 RepID=A0AAD8XKY8_GLOAC|nr:uncharacterized protein BDZ83DRAFT_647959 [Colletotrichum acutatum]KAK1729313.1 hypothetical protein BDZ83DRAFT_647959 [Colletotrichum acutatum]
MSLSSHLRALASSLGWRVFTPSSSDGRYAVSIVVLRTEKRIGAPNLLCLLEAPLRRHIDAAAAHWKGFSRQPLPTTSTCTPSGMHPFPSTGASTGSVTAARTVFWLCAATITASRGSVAA